MDQKKAAETSYSEIIKTAAGQHAILLAGAPAACAAASYELAAAILCTGPGRTPCRACEHCGKVSRRVHPDLSVLDGSETGMIYVDEIRALRGDAVILPNEADKKIYLIFGAEYMNTAAQNAILKLLEEPPPHAVFILTAENPSALLMTVRSRCVEIYLHSQNDAQANESADVEAFFKALGDGPVALLTFSFSLEKFEKDRLISFVDGARAGAVHRLREALLGAPGMPEAALLLKAERALSRADEFIEHNVGAGHIAGLLAAALTGQSEDHHD
ncbi:hypothetical protein IZU99_10375 [Oscillospiraceae bacterium CM]|nr:hypothetical protein IZU99_10375 [Oscillospiraceae bacterium CM]